MPANMSYNAYSTKERYEELQKNPLVFGKFGLVNIQDEMGYNHPSTGWGSCDSTICFFISEQTLSNNDSGRRLFVIGKQVQLNEKIDGNKEGQDNVCFEITEFNVASIVDWRVVFNDCLYNYKSGNTRHCHMALFWALYVMSWEEDVIKKALQELSIEAVRVACNYISANILMLSLNKQKAISSIFKEANPDIQPLMVPDVENALKELSPSNDFSNYGFYQKVDYILGFGNTEEERNHLQELYKKSRNGFVHFKYWIENPGHNFFNYNYLEFIYACVDSIMQLSIVKRYLHDVRLILTQVDYSLLKNLRDVRYQSYIDIRYFVTKPGDNIDLVAPLFCDTLLTLKNSEGNKIQDFNGLLDFAVSHSNKTYPSIDLGVRHFLPTCDGGLIHNTSFLGFVHYDLLYTLDKFLLTDDNLRKTVDYLLNKYAELQYHYCCADDNYREIPQNEVEKCRLGIFPTICNKESIGKSTKSIGNAKCQSLTKKPIEPHIWKRTGTSDKILGLFIENVGDKEYITSNDVSIDKLKESLLEWGQKFQTFVFVNGVIPKNLQEKDVSRHIVQNYYSPTWMRIYPNHGMIFSSTRSLLGAWDDKTIKDPMQKEKMALQSEPPIVFNNTFEALRKMYPNSEIGRDYIKLPYDGVELRKILDCFHFHQHVYDLEKGYGSLQNWNKTFLAPRTIQGVFYCSPKEAGAREKVSNMPFFWCRGDECFCNMLGDQTLDRQDDWKKYTLFHAAEILGYKLIETEKGNTPVEAVSNFVAEVRQAEKLYARLICRNCGHMIFSTRGTILGGSHYFACANSQCSNYRKEIYLSHCYTCKKGLIDSRDSEKCENGWVICPSCLSCCSDEMFDRIIAKFRRGGYIPPRLLEYQGHGHNDKDIFFCPKCGSRLGDYKVEEKVRLDNGKEDILIQTIYGCPQCKKKFERELEAFRNRTSSPKKVKEMNETT